MISVYLLLDLQAREVLSRVRVRLLYSGGVT